MSDQTPIIVGVGQYSERMDTPSYRALSPVALAAEAAKAACEDAKSVAAIAGRIDWVAGVRQFENSVPFAKAPFGRSNNFPRSVASRLGASPKHAVLEIAGGQAPQKLVGEACEKIAAGECRMALIFGAEAISTVRGLAGKEEKPNWSETVDGQLEDRGFGLKGLTSRTLEAYGILGAPPGYALLENGRRKRLGLSKRGYAEKMGKLFERFTEVAAQHLHAAAPQRQSAEDLITATERNRMIAEPYTRMLVARDQVNQGAAVLLTSVDAARELGIPESKWIYLHSYTNLKERIILERQDLGASPASTIAIESALELAGVKPDELSFIDFYSCFPIPVFMAKEALNISPDDPRDVTLTGGLPFFGGAGNNYSMHAIATMVEKLREKPGSYGLVGANGGFASKYSAAVYSTKPTEFRKIDSKPLQKKIDELPAPAFEAHPRGWATVESYTVLYDKGSPVKGVVIGRLAESGARFVASTPEEAPEILERMLADDPLSLRIYVGSFFEGNRFAFAEDRLRELYPPKPAVVRSDYEFLKVEKRDHLLEVTINRPEVRNCLHPPCHKELDEVFNAFEADDSLWVAIITGAGTDAFCTGNDLKWSASGKPVHIPESGFAGLTQRQRVKPLIVAVNGYAMGGGLEICLAADLVVADATAKFALSEVRVGLIAGAGGIVRLPRQIPKKLATEMILTGRRVGPEEGRQLGFVNRITDAGKALDGARQLAAEILEGSPTSVRLSMQLMNEVDHIPAEMDAALYDPPLIDELLSSEDFFEGVTAFSQKRKPNWKNR